MTVKYIIISAAMVILLGGGIAVGQAKGNSRMGCMMGMGMMGNGMMRSMMARSDFSKEDMAKRCRAFTANGSSASDGGRQCQQRGDNGAYKGE